jgi:hypothetical protein
MVMAIIDPELVRSIQAEPEVPRRVIVRVDGDMDERQPQLESLGFAVATRSRLIRGFGATASGIVIMQAQDQEWIISIEPDTTLHTM